MILIFQLIVFDHMTIPRTRGGDPSQYTGAQIDEAYSPHPRG